MQSPFDNEHILQEGAPKTHTEYIGQARAKCLQCQWRHRGPYKKTHKAMWEHFIEFHHKTEIQSLCINTFTFHNK